MALIRMIISSIIQTIDGFLGALVNKLLEGFQGNTFEAVLGLKTHNTLSMLSLPNVSKSCIIIIFIVVLIFILNKIQLSTDECKEWRKTQIPVQAAVNFYYLNSQWGNW